MGEAGAGAGVARGRGPSTRALLEHQPRSKHFVCHHQDSVNEILFLSPFEGRGNLSQVPWGCGCKRWSRAGWPQPEAPLQASMPLTWFRQETMLLGSQWGGGVASWWAGRGPAGAQSR